MTPIFHKQFQKQYHRLPVKLQNQFDRRLELFLSDKHHPKLRVHPLKGSYLGYHSLDVSGDYRAIFKLYANQVIFIAIGSHTGLYD